MPLSRPPQSTPSIVYHRPTRGLFDWTVGYCQLMDLHIIHGPSSWSTEASLSLNDPTRFASNDFRSHTSCNGNALIFTHLRGHMPSLFKKDCRHMDQLLARVSTRFDTTAEKPPHPPILKAFCAPGSLFLARDSCVNPFFMVKIVNTHLPFLVYGASFFLLMCL